MIFNRLTTCCCFLFCANVLSAQTINTNVYLFDLAQTANNQDGKGYIFYNPRYITDFNRYGYNNQPHFSTNNDLLLSISMPDDTLQTDIYQFSLLDNTKNRITATAEAEYSPQITPDRQFISCVRVDAQDKTKQRLWKYPIDRSNEGKAILKYNAEVGYYTWLNDYTVALWVLNGGEGYLSLTNVNTESSTRLQSNIGRCMVRMPDGKLGFVSKDSPTEWYIRTLDLNTYTPQNIIKTLPDAEDFVCLPDGSIFMAAGSKLYRYKIGADTNWVEIADFSNFGIRNIKRIAVSKDLDKIVVVNNN